jgi:hypothetical protein
MFVSRRKFLLAGQTLLAAVALPTKFFGAASSLNLGSSGATILATATKATFQPLVNSSFSVQVNSLTTAWLTLLSVEDMNPKSPSGLKPMVFGLNAPKPAPQQTTDTFALHFYGTGETLAQGTYDLEHHVLGKFQLFVVPAGTSEYTAVISHLQTALPIRAPKRLTPMAQVGAPKELDSL